MGRLLAGQCDCQEEAGSPAIAPRDRHIAVLDGVRGVAILVVMIHHMTLIPPWGAQSAFDIAFARFAYCGWVGVDLFFVLSGFLITGILLDARGQPAGPYFRNFYARRALRIFPLYYALLAIVFVVLPMLPVAKLQSIGRANDSGVWYWLFLSNVRFASLSGFPSPILGVTWSLAVEEHFYLLWPAVVFLLAPRTLARVCVGIILVALGSRVAMTLSQQFNPISIYVLTFCRMDGLAIGALLALLVRAPGVLTRMAPLARIALWPLVLGSIALILLGPPYWGQRRVQTIGYTLFAIASAALIVRALTADPRGALRRLLESRLMVALGRFSFALYLIHLPIRALVRDLGFDHARFPRLWGSAVPGQLLFYALSMSLCLAVAWASYHLFEKHFLKAKSLFPARQPRPAAPAPIPTVPPLHAVSDLA